MCDIKEVSERADLIIKNANDAITASGANIQIIEDEMKVIARKSKQNIRKLSFLL